MPLSRAGLVSGAGGANVEREKSRKAGDLRCDDLRRVGGALAAATHKARTIRAEISSIDVVV